MLNNTMVFSFYHNISFASSLLILKILSSTISNIRLINFTHFPKKRPLWRTKWNTFYKEQTLENCIVKNSVRTKTRTSNKQLQYSFLQGWKPPFLREPPSFWSKFKKIPTPFWQPSKLVHVNCMKHFKMKVLHFELY